jgi:Holliday junction resolvasome RuvABC endonuclease subunit
MKDDFVVLSMDLGKNIGVACVRGENILYGKEYTFQNHEWLYELTQTLIKKFEPDVILIPYPTRFYYTMIAHAKMMGVICCVAENRDILVVEVNDASCKKIVLGSGKAKKPEIMAYFKQENEHIADALMFCKYFQMSQ